MKEVTWNGHVINGGDWVVSECKLFGSAPAVAQSGQRVGYDGIWRTKAFHGAKSGAIKGYYVGQSLADAEEAMETLLSVADINPKPLTVNTPRGPKTMYVARDSALDITFLANGSAFEWGATLIAPDPVWWRGGQTPDGQIDDQYTAKHRLYLPNLTGGIKFPIKYPISFLESGNYGSVTVSSGYHNRVSLKLYGYVQIPSVIFSGPGGAGRLRWDFTLQQDEWLDIDLTNRTSLRQGQSAAAPTIREWPELGRGELTIGFRSDVYSPTAYLDVIVRQVTI